jgi:hypothetical protein
MVASRLSLPEAIYLIERETWKYVESPGENNAPEASRRAQSCASFLCSISLQTSRTHPVPPEACPSREPLPLRTSQIDAKQSFPTLSRARRRTCLQGESRKYAELIQTGRVHAVLSSRKSPFRDSFLRVRRLSLELGVRFVCRDNRQR